MPEPTPRWSRETHEALSAAGWQPGRAVDVAPYVRCLRRWALECVAPARATLSELGGLRIPCRPHWGSSRRHIVLDPCAILHYATVYEDVDWFRELGARLGEVVTPLAEVEDLYLVLQGESGRVYADCDSKIMLAGANIDVAIDAIVRRLAFEEADALPPDDDDDGW